MTSRQGADSSKQRGTLRARRPWLLLVAGVGTLAVALASVLASDRIERMGTVASNDRGGCVPTGARPGPAYDQGVDGDWTDVQRQLDAGVRAGSSIVSATASWPALRPTPSRPYKWTALDRTIELARAAGQRVRLRLLGMPAWAEQDGSATPGSSRPPVTDAELAAWAAFVSDLMTHVRGRVDYVEIWDEPNSPASWPTGPDPRAYAALLYASYPVVKRIDPDVVVISGSLRRNDLVFLSGLYQAFDESVVSRPFDMLGLHTFDSTPRTPAGTPVWPYGRQPFRIDGSNVLDLRRVHALLGEHGDAHKHLYLSDVADADGATPPHRLVRSWGESVCAPYVFALSSSPPPAPVEATSQGGSFFSDRDAADRPQRPTSRSQRERRHRACGAPRLPRAGR
ncbi:hypothetical protein [Nocardioides sp. LHG3406-4]|uniref:hypothetical protein n=1 Tax=Nocardioides sp. LHG3406-4 TaxID=2804575 RepID=UPI003CFAE669